VHGRALLVGAAQAQVAVRDREDRLELRDEPGREAALDDPPRVDREGALGGRAPAALLDARALILRRHSALNRTIAEFGGFDPFILEPSDDAPVEGEPDAQTTSEGAAAEPDAVTTDRDPIADAMLPWVAGFEQALHAFPALVEMGGSAVDTTLARLFRFLPETGEESRAVAAVLARERPLASLDDAIAELVGAVAELYDLTEPLRYKVERVRRETPKVGRNDPCPCGSGKKFKQCHGAAGAPPLA